MTPVLWVALGIGGGVAIAAVAVYAYFACRYFWHQDREEP